MYTSQGQKRSYNGRVLTGSNGSTTGLIDYIVALRQMCVDNSIQLKPVCTFKSSPVTNNDTGNTLIYEHARSSGEKTPLLGLAGK